MIKHFEHRKMNYLMTRLVIAGILCCSFSYLQGQEKFGFYGVANALPEAVKIYLDSAAFIQYTNALKSIELTNTAIERAIQVNDATGEAVSYLFLGDVQFRLGRFRQAIDSYEKCIRVFGRENKSYYASNAMPDDRILFFACIQLALAEENLGKVKAALESISRSRESRFAEIDKDLYAEANRIKARLKTRSGESDVGMSLLTSQLEQESSSGDARGQFLTLVRMGDCYLLMGDNERAKDSMLRAKEVAEKNQKGEWLLEVNSALAGIYSTQGNLTMELDMRNSNIALNQSNNDVQRISDENIAIGKAYLRADNVEMAERYFELGLESNDDAVNFDNGNTSGGTTTVVAPIQMRSTELQVGADAYRELAEGYLRKNEFQKALDFYMKYAVLQDSVKVVHELELAEAIELSGSIGMNQARIELLERERELSVQSIDTLMQDQLVKEGQLVNRNLIIGILLVGLLLIVAGGVFMIRNTRARRRADKLLTLQSLSGQMNPHFIFNALNSVNEFISQNDERAANRYLSSFSRLMRQVMDDSKHTFIPLSDELEMLNLYLRLEHARFKEQFDYHLEVSDLLSNADCELPPMFVQPFLENAIWHGLRYRSGKGKLDIRFLWEEECLVIEIVDNGIGMVKSKKLKTMNQKKQNSLGMQNILTRIQLMNEIFDMKMAVNVREARSGDEFPGTYIRMIIPQHGMVARQKDSHLSTINS